MTTFGGSGTNRASATAKGGSGRSRRRAHGKHSRIDGPKRRDYELRDGTQVVITLPSSSYSSWGQAQLASLDVSKKEPLSVQLPRRLAQSLGKTLKTHAQDIDRTQLNNVLEQLEKSSATSRLVQMLNRKDYSIKEATKKLIKEGYQQPVVMSVVEAATAGNLLNDMRFTEIYARSHMLQGIGRTKIEMKLKQQGVDIQGTQELLDELFVESEYDRAYELASKKSFSEKNTYEKIVRFLVSRGYSYGISKDVAGRLQRECK